MLVLTRKAGERIEVGDDVVVTISRIKGNRVAVGIEAPLDRKIIRSELKSKDIENGDRGRASDD